MENQQTVAHSYHRSDDSADEEEGSPSRKRKPDEVVSVDLKRKTRNLVTIRLVRGGIELLSFEKSAHEDAYFQEIIKDAQQVRPVLKHSYGVSGILGRGSRCETPGTNDLLRNPPSPKRITRNFNESVDQIDTKHGFGSGESRGFPRCYVVRVVTESTAQTRRTTVSAICSVSRSIGIR
jgi:hypothetical protein